MSESLIIFPTEDSNEFNYNIFINFIISMDGVYNTFAKKESKYSSFAGIYQYNNKEIFFYIGKTKPFVSVKTLTKAALNFAIELQKLSPVSLTATNDSYSFLCNLENISSIEEFKKIISQNIYMDKQ